MERDQVLVSYCKVAKENHHESWVDHLLDLRAGLHAQPFRDMLQSYQFVKLPKRSEKAINQNWGTQTWMVSYCLLTLLLKIDENPWFLTSQLPVLGDGIGNEVTPKFVHGLASTC